MIEGEHLWWPARRRALRVVGRRTIWGTEVVDGVDPSEGRVVRVPAADLTSLDQRSWSTDEVIWRAAAARAVAEAAAGRALAAASTGVELLPHQAQIVAAALERDPVRLGAWVSNRR